MSQKWDVFVTIVLAMRPDAAPEVRDAILGFAICSPAKWALCKESLWALIRKSATIVARPSGLEYTQNF
jgi:hypothetical protein